MTQGTDENQVTSLPLFSDSELDKLLRQMVDKERGNYFEHGTAGRGIPSKLKKIIDDNIERLTS